MSRGDSHNTPHEVAMHQPDAPEVVQEITSGTYTQHHEQVVEPVDEVRHVEHVQVEHVQEPARRRSMWQRIGAVFAASALTFGATQPAVAQSERAESLQEQPPLQPGQTRTVQVTPHRLIVGNLASIGTTNSPSWSAVFGETYGGTSVANPKGAGNVAANAFFANSGPNGEVTVMSGVAPQHQVLDLKIELPITPGMRLEQNPKRIADTRLSGGQFARGDVLTLDFGQENGGRTALLNIAVDRSTGAAWYAAYPCNEGYAGTSSVNTDGVGATSTAEIVRIDSNGRVCIIGSQPAAGVIVDSYGTTDWEVQAPERILDTRITGQRLRAGQEHIIRTGKPNSLFIGKLAIDRAAAPGWFSAYPAAGGYQGDSLVNPDGRSATSGLMIIPTDSEGNIAIFGSVDADLIVDMAGLISLQQLGIDPSQVRPPQRMLDTREYQPPVARDCNLAVVGREIGQQVTTRVIDVQNGTVVTELGTRTGYLTDENYSFSPDCREVYYLKNVNGTRQFFARNLITGAEQQRTFSRYQPDSYIMAPDGTAFSIQDNVMYNSINRERNIDPTTIYFPQNGYYIGNLQLTPDMSTIAYMEYAASNTGDVKVVIGRPEVFTYFSGDTGYIIRNSSTIQIPRSPNFNGFSLSDDGRQIAYVGPDGAIRLQNVSDASVRVISAPAGYRLFNDVHLDNGYIYAVASTSARATVIRMNLDGTNPVPITEDYATFTRVFEVS